ncbi:hypothetical protein R7P65_10685 [Vibrio sp. Vb0718]|uniref:hypothetical protein n=1 Tax=Vibrio sp. Vb0718 TaxID=3074630 RepID=UPI002963C8CA|nr:hypothetical protein [Vibrio sp. Vb0718]MDG2841116.1 hypothetical protein [Vibrio parahaemolyticus]MDG2862775.1 hypothetical protein [Vibrio parahaemolyticus]MDW1835736.1 hypothetical protein [Vibrio sp. Vb0718]
MLTTEQLQRYNELSALLCIEETRKLSESMEHVNYLYTVGVQNLIDEGVIQVEELHRSIHQTEYTRATRLQQFEHNNIKLLFCVSSFAERKFQVAVFVGSANKRLSLSSCMTDELLEGKLND